MTAIGERWLDKRGLAEHLACSVRSIETAITEGMPHAILIGRVKFQVSEVESWLRRTGNALGAEPWSDTLRRDPCSYCGGRADHVDHIVARADGGEGCWTNYTTACCQCNQAKGSRSLLFWLARRT
ncbi:MAG: HNH endonuclease [Solirubrobacteraceae bacterium]